MRLREFRFLEFRSRSKKRIHLEMQEFQSWLDQHQESMADELEQLCNLNSGSHSNDGLTQVADWLVDYFAPLKVPVQTIELQSYEAVDDLGLRRTYKTGNALRWDIGCLPINRN